MSHVHNLQEMMELRAATVRMRAEALTPGVIEIFFEALKVKLGGYPSTTRGDRIIHRLSWLRGDILERIDIEDRKAARAKKNLEALEADVLELESRLSASKDALERARRGEAVQ